MNCFLCNEKMVPYFCQSLYGYKRSFVRCPVCGLVIDETTYEMDEEEWSEKNRNFHTSYQGTEENMVDPDWINRLKKRSSLFVQLFQTGAFPLESRAVDYGCGDGKLSAFFLQQYMKLDNFDGRRQVLPKIGKYDKYMSQSGDTDYFSSRDVCKKGFDIVITCSVFEHLLGKKDVDEILGLLSDKGIFCLHTLVCEEVPEDPEWYYLLPVHCTIWTNKAMSKLYTAYGFRGCAYNVEARMWLMYKDVDMFKGLKEKSGYIDGSWFFSEDFVDFWKGKPYK